MTRPRLLPLLVVVVVATTPTLAMGQAAVAAPTATATAPRDPTTTAAVALALKVVALAASAEAEVDAMLGTATRDHDVVKSTYLTEKKAQIGVVGKIAQARRKLLVAAAGRGDKEVAIHLAPLLNSLEARLAELRAQAHQAVGMPARATAKSEPSHHADTTDDTSTDDVQLDDAPGSGSAATGGAAPLFWIPLGLFPPPSVPSPTK